VPQHVWKGFPASRSQCMWFSPCGIMYWGLNAVRHLEVMRAQGRWRTDIWGLLPTAGIPKFCSGEFGSPSPFPSCYPCLDSGWKCRQRGRRASQLTLPAPGTRGENLSKDHQARSQRPFHLPRKFMEITDNLLSSLCPILSCGLGHFGVFPVPRQFARESWP
jgi:hypothetical protein